MGENGASCPAAAAPSRSVRRAMPRTLYKHDSQTVERGLAAVLHAHGNSRRAQRQLAGEGIEVDHSTLHRWRHRHPNRYEQLARKEG